MSTPFSLFVNLFIVPATSKKSEAGSLFLEMAVITALLGIGFVIILFIVAPMFSLGTETVSQLQVALGQ